MLFTFMFVLVDTGLQYLNIYINKWYVAQKEKAVKEQAKKAQASKSVIRRKVSVYEGKFFKNSADILLSYRSRICILTRGWK